MPQGDASQYPILPISLSIMAFCFIISFLVSLLVDYAYDFYLVKLSKNEQKKMIENRVKGDFKRFREFLQSQKLEKFNADEAKNRLTIVTNLLMETIDSKKIGIIETVPKIEKEKNLNNATKVETIKKEDNVDKSEVENEQKNLTNTNNEQRVETENKKVIIKDLNESQPKEISENKKIPIPVLTKSSTPISSQTTAQSQKTNDSSKLKSLESENKNERVILAKETTIEDIIKKLSLAPRSATVFIEIRETKEKESSPKETRGSSIKFTPPSTIGTVESDFRFNSDEMNSSSNSHSKLNEKKSIQYPKQNSDLMEIINRKSALNQNLSKTFRDNQSKMIQERLKLDAEFRKTRHAAPKKRSDDTNKFNTFDEDDDSESQNVTKQVFE